MNQTETNIYLIKNLEKLNCKYKTYQIRGLSHESEDYDKNIQFLVNTLSRKTKSPIDTFKTDQGTFLAQPEDFDDLPVSENLVRTIIKIEKMPELQELKFDTLDSITAKLALRFLQFSLQQPLYDNPSLWQPRSGYPFYHKVPDKTFKSSDIDLFRGFTFRFVLLQDGKIGICVDISSKYVSRYPLPANISRNDFRKYKGLNCLYEYGDSWYEIKIEGLNDLKANEVPLPDDTSLFEDVHRKAGSRKSPNLLSLPRDCSVLTYYTSRGDQRNVPSGLCRLTYRTEHPHVSAFHSKTIKPPHIRRREIQTIVNTYFRNLKFGSTEIILSDKPITVNTRRFEIPDLEFGNGKVLSVRGTPNSIPTSLENFGSKKKELIYSDYAGLFVKKPFDRQYCILPNSIYDSFGKKFMEDIKNEIHELFSSDEGIVYSPIPIYYDDSVQKSVYNLGREIISAVEESNAKPGYGLVMVPKVKSKIPSQEDELANLIMRELRERDIYVSIIHTTVPTNSYEYGRLEDGSESWKLVGDFKQQGLFKGYVRNVVLNKILLLNSFWPFILKTPLNADLTIGIDVKNNVAGFILIYKTGEEIKFRSSESDQKEQLSKDHTRSKMLEILREDKEMLLSKNIKNVVIHRQGKLFPKEMVGIDEALNILAAEKLIQRNYQSSFVELRMTSRVPVRLFRVESMPGSQGERTYNPIIGTYYPLSENEAFICNTGPPFIHKGTTKPLHIVKISGKMPLEHILEDIFYLSNLTWTKVDDCSRDPLSIKMADIRLREIAGEYDKDSLEFIESEEEGGDEDE